MAPNALSSVERVDLVKIGTLNYGTIQHITSQTLATPPLTAWNLPGANPFFVERTELFAKMSAALKASEKPVTLFAYGLGGVGKSQLAQDYILHPPCPYPFRAWFQATTTALLTTQYKDLAQALGLCDETANAALVINRMKQWLESHPGWLIVYDDVQHYNELQSFLPKQGGQTLLTSRDASLHLKGSIFVDVMSEAQAILLLQKTSGRCDWEMSVLAKELGYLPLALAQAGAYILQTPGTTTQGYLTLYQALKKELLADKTLPAGSEHEPVYLTWNVNMAAIEKEEPAATAVINSCIWLASANMPWSLLKRFLATEGRSEAQITFRFNNIIQLLQRYSLCTLNQENQTLAMHQLVQTVRQEQLSLSEQVASLQLVIEQLLAEDPDECNVKLDAYKRLLLPHLERVYSHAMRLEPSPEVNLGREIYLLVNKLGVVYLDFLEEPRRAQEFLDKALAMAQARYGESHPDVAVILNNLGLAYGELGNAEEQTTLLERALAIKEKHYGPEHGEVASTLINLGNAYGDLGNPQEQKTLLERALAIEEKHYDLEHVNVAKTLINLSIAYGALGNAEEKKTLLERGLAILEKHHGSEHVEVARMLGNLGNAYDDLGNAEEQKTLLERALAIVEEHYGPEHVVVTTTLTNLGLAYGALGNAEEQKKLLERTLAIEEKHYGPEHVKVARTLVNLGNACGQLGDLHEEKKRLERALMIKERYYGPHHPEIAKTLANLSFVNSGSGDHQKAKEERSRAFSIINHCPDVDASQPWIVMLKQMEETWQEFASLFSLIESLPETCTPPGEEDEALIDAMRSIRPQS